jgi:hypothetical protein
MPIEYKTRVAHLIDTVGVEDAEALLTWLSDTPACSINLKRCSHIHSAALQAILFEQPKISRLPENQQLLLWLNAAGLIKEGQHHD